MIKPEDLAKSGSEDAHQAALFCWCNLNLHLYPQLKWLFAIPNGGYRDKITAGKLKATGVKSGVPDICLPCPTWTHKIGLFIELKVGKNKTSENQNEWIEYLKNAGYDVYVCYGWEDARDRIVEYLK